MQSKLKDLKWLWFALGAVVLIVLGLFLDAGGNFSEPKEVAIEKNIEHSEITGNMYRNTKYHFRIKFPDAWEIKTGDGLHIVQKAVNENSTISVSVHQLEIGKNQGFSSIKDLGSSKEVSEIMTEGAKEKFSNVKIVDSGEIKIDNEPAYWIEYSTTGQVLDRVISMTNLTYMLAKNDTMYIISGGTATSDFAKTKPIFQRAVSTFVLEKY
jgi:hypothetical protein